MKKIIILILLLIPLLAFINPKIVKFIQNELTINEDGTITREDTGNTDLLPYAWGRYQINCNGTETSFGTDNFIFGFTSDYSVLAFFEPIAQDLNIVVTPTFGCALDIGILTPQVSVDYSSTTTINIRTYTRYGDLFRGGYSFVAYYKPS